MIIYYITYLSYRGKLHNYLFLNDTNFYLSASEEKNGFIKVGVKIKIIDAMSLSLNLPR